MVAYNCFLFLGATGEWPTPWTWHHIASHHITGRWLHAIVFFSLGPLESGPCIIWKFRNTITPHCMTSHTISLLWVGKIINIDHQTYLKVLDDLLQLEKQDLMKMTMWNNYQLLMLQLPHQQQVWSSLKKGQHLWKHQTTRRAGRHYAFPFQLLNNI